MTCVNYNIVNHGLSLLLTERWHEEISSFRLRLGDIVGDVSYRLYLPIMKHFLDHEKKLTRDKGLEFMVDLIGVDPEEANYVVELRNMARFSYLKFVVQRLLISYSSTPLVCTFVPFMKAWKSTRSC